MIRGVNKEFIMLITLKGNNFLLLLDIIMRLQQDIPLV